MLSSTIVRGSLAAALAAAGPSLAQISSTFDLDTEGWGGLNDFRDVQWTGSVGNPAGALQAFDRGAGTIWYFSAPVAYLGDQSANLGGSISWDILGIAGNQTSITNRADVVLQGAGLSIGIDLGVQPLLGDWTSWSAPLADGAGWKIVNSLSGGTLSPTDATATQIEAVLADLTGLHIRGEFTNTAGDSTAIDNVSFVPAPASAAMFGLAGFAAARRRR